MSDPSGFGLWGLVKGQSLRIGLRSLKVYAGNLCGHLMNGLVQFADVQQNLIQFKHSDMQRVILVWMDSALKVFEVRLKQF